MNRRCARAMYDNDGQGKTRKYGQRPIQKGIRNAELSDMRHMRTAKLG
jgi:hypothetical protein